MLKIKCKQLRLSSKGNLKRFIGNGIPVLSIFALVGIMCASISVSNIDNLSFGSDNYRAYLAETDSASSTDDIMPLADTSASLTIDDGKIKDTIFATNGEFAYATHKVSINATNIKSYTLTLAKTAGLTGPSTVNDAGTGVTPANMDNQWGYAWIGENDNPTTATYKTLSTANNLADIAIDSNHNVNASKQLVFGAKFGSSAASGTYHAEATLSLVATPYTVVNYSVSYNLNGGTSSAIAATTASDDTGASSKTLKVTSTVPTRSGYKFLGWATSSTDSVAYASGANITLQASNPTTTLYAAWQQDIQGLKSITNMQQMTADICKNSAVGDTNTLTDARDSSTYTVAKLSDGNCWMTQNLRIAGKTITATDSDMSSGSFIIPNSESNFTGTSNNAAYYGGDVDNGAHYSWYTATAGVGTNAMTSGEAASSICPKGWKLPKGGASGDFQALYNKWTTATWTTNDDKYGRWLGASNTTEGGAFFLATGYYDKTSRITGDGYYWSRTAFSTGNSNDLNFTSKNIYPAKYDFKYLGCAIRCIAYSS